MLFALCSHAQASVFSARVLAVLDGDTLLVARDNHLVRIRLADIDAPEKDQPYGMESQQSLAGMVKGREVQIAGRAMDDYGRMVADVSIDGTNVNHEQVRRGMAWEYSRFHSNRVLFAMQIEARLEKRGLWLAGDDAVEPAQWRRSHSGVPTASREEGQAATETRAAPDGNLCGGKRRCAQMVSCEEARRYLAQCGPESLDGDRDGVPCEKLCADGVTR